MVCCKTFGTSSLAAIGFVVVCGTAVAQPSSGSGERVSAVVTHSTIISEREAARHLHLAEGGGEALQSPRVLAEPRAVEAIRVRDLGAQRIIGRIAGDITGLLAAFVAMCSLGFGLVFFAPRQLEVVTNTVHDSFGRSFFVGLLAQPLVVPVFGLLMLGLALTVVGILVIPFAAIAFAAAAVLGVLGGYLAVARSIGEAYLRRRRSLGHAVGGWLSYRYIVYGLVALFTIWLPAALFGWAPIAGQIFTVTAILISWIFATAGFGATILSRAGIRATFTRRFDQSFSDEYLFRTPQATKVVLGDIDIDRVDR